MRRWRLRGVAGLRVNYGCPGDVSLVGDVDRSAPTWRIFAVRAGAAVRRAVEIRAAYYSRGVLLMEAPGPARPDVHRAGASSVWCSTVPARSRC